MEVGALGLPERADRRRRQIRCTMPSPPRECTTKAHYTFYPADSIGGELYYSAGLSVMSDLYSPKSGQPLPVKAHCWLNAGRLDGIDRGMSFRAPRPFFN